MTVYVDEDGDSERDLTEPYASTSLSGSYALEGLEPGVHTVRIEAFGQCSAPDPCVRTVAVGAGSTEPASFMAWRMSRVTGAMFIDLDGDGAAREPGEPAPDLAFVYVDRDRDGSPDEGESVHRLEEGSYAIAELPPGTHVFRPVLPRGWRCLRPVPCEAEVHATSGSSLVAPDFGIAEPEADLGVTVARTPERVVAGESVEWTVTAANDGPGIASSTRLEIQLPAGLRDAVVSGPEDVDCVTEGRTTWCDLVDLLSGAQLQFTVRARVEPDRAGATLRVAALVDADTNDPDSSDNLAESSSTVAGVADLRTSATLPATVDVGEVVDLVVELRNDGPSDASGLELVATLPEGFDPVADELPEGCTADGREVTCAAENVPVGGSFARSIRVKVGPEAAGRALTVPVDASSDASDPTPADAAAEVPVQARAVDPPPAPELKPEAKPDVVVDAPPAAAAAACRSLRVFDIHVSRRYGRLRKVSMTLAGRRVAVRRRHGRFTARVDLRGMPAGEYVLKIRAVTDEGRVVRGVRRYRTCSSTSIVRRPPL